MWIIRHWKAALGAICLAPSIVTTFWRAVGFIGNVDFVVTHVQDPGWIGTIANAFLNPPVWSIIPTILVGLGLIWWDKRRHLQAAISPNHGSVVTLSEAANKRPALRRLCKLVDDMELISLVQSNDRAFVLSHWKPDGSELSRIRVDAIHLDGSRDESFGQGGDGFASFTIPGSRRALAHRLALLADSGLLIVGTIFYDENNTSVAFVAKISGSGALDSSFGRNGISEISQGGRLCYGSDAVQSGDYIFCLLSTFDSAIIRINKLTMTGNFVDVTELSLADSGMAWPSRMIGTFPDNGFLIAGKLIENGSAKTGGFLVKLHADLSLDEGFSGQGILMLNEHLRIPLVHQIFDVLALPTGIILIAGSGNEGFVVGVDTTGHPVETFCRSGLYEARATYRTTATSLAYSRRRRAVSLAGFESDGNSINRPIVGLIDLEGRSLLSDEEDPIVVRLDAHSFRVQHVILEDGHTLAAIQEGSLSSGRKCISLTTFALLPKAKYF